MPTRQEILTNLHRVLDAIPDHLFDMGVLGYFIPPCSIVGCLFGHAAIDPWFSSNTTIAQTTHKTTPYPPGLQLHSPLPDQPTRTLTISHTLVIATQNRHYSYPIAHTLQITPPDAMNLFAFNPDPTITISKDQVRQNLARLQQDLPAIPYRPPQPKQHTPPANSTPTSNTRSPTASPRKAFAPP